MRPSESPTATTLQRLSSVLVESCARCTRSVLQACSPFAVPVRLLHDVDSGGQDLAQAVWVKVLNLRVPEGTSCVSALCLGPLQRVTCLGACAVPLAQCQNPDSPAVCVDADQAVDMTA